MNVIALLLSLVMWTGAADRFAGHYVLENAREMGSELVLKPGGTFEYMLAYGAADYTATGKWRVAGDKVVLDTKVPEGPPLKVLETTMERTPDVRIWVMGRNGRPVPNLDVRLTASNGEATARTDSDGMAIFPNTTNPRSAVVHIVVYHFDSPPLALNSAHNTFTLEINGDVITTVPFKGEALRVKGDTLEMTYWDKTKPMVYRRQ
ncbi:hypothetical protein [Edaphobacter aggregans]|uniref:hypothetical protein n=1 Tax=Edaphobacter aggregans TaxID=570835 RepID=UPI00068B7276|nr:hypothetical protein [Edaphobacter aggregans]